MPPFYCIDEIRAECLLSDCSRSFAGSPAGNDECGEEESCSQEERRTDDSGPQEFDEERFSEDRCGIAKRKSDEAAIRCDRRAHPPTHTHAGAIQRDPAGADRQGVSQVRAERRLGCGFCRSSSPIPDRQEPHADRQDHRGFSHRPGAGSETGGYGGRETAAGGRPGRSSVSGSGSELTQEARGILCWDRLAAGECGAGTPRRCGETAQVNRTSE